MIKLQTCIALFCFLICSTKLLAQDYQASDFSPHNVVISDTSFKGRQAISLSEPQSTANSDGGKLAILNNLYFQNGEIELWIASELREGAVGGARGFVGIAFRIDQDDFSNYEAVYIRPANGRADDQLRRNHAIQYISHPEYTWNRLRSESPSQYEAYADMELAKWIKYRLVVDGERAELYLDDNEQPNLIVNDLKHGDRAGGVGLWLDNGTIAYYSNLKVFSSE